MTGEPPASAVGCGDDDSESSSIPKIPAIRHPSRAAIAESPTVVRSIITPIRHAEAIVSENGTIVIENTPFQPGEKVEVTVSNPAAPEREVYYPLRETVYEYIDPFDSVAEDDWNAFK